MDDYSEIALENLQASNSRLRRDDVGEASKEGGKFSADVCKLAAAPSPTDQAFVAPSSSGRTPDFDSGNCGSNPRGATTDQALIEGLAFNESKTYTLPESDCILDFTTGYDAGYKAATLAMQQHVRPLVEALERAPKFKLGEDPDEFIASYICWRIGRLNPALSALPPVLRGGENE